MKTHWHLGYSNKTACGLLAYPEKTKGEFCLVSRSRIDCAEQPKHVSCRSCQQVMLLNRIPPWERI
jgi:hypothetical protein